MNGFIKLYVSINELYNFLSGDEGHGYTKASEDGHWNIEIFVPAERIIVSDYKNKDDYGSYLIEWVRSSVG